MYEAPAETPPDSPPRPPLPARLNRDQIRRHYRWIAPMHDVAARLLESKARRQALTWADVRNGEDVLDVGTGTGLNLPALLAANPSGTTEALDLTEAMLDRARRRAARFPDARVRLRVGDVYALPYPDDAFDLIVCGYMLDLLPLDDLPAIFRSFARVLRPGGRVVATAMAVPRTRRHALWDALYRFYPALLGGCRGIDLAEPARAAGFDPVRTAYVAQCTFPSLILYAAWPATPPPDP